MSKYIKDHSLTVGFNPISEQKFFKLLKRYEKYIHSYFFSLTHGLVGNKYNPKDILAILGKCDTYNIPGNILFNTYESEEKWEKQIELVKDIINLQGVTVLTPEIGRVIKEKYPDLEIHLSVRFWDWHEEKSTHELFEENIDIFKEVISIINISGFRSYNDHELRNKIKDLGIQTKFIANEGCITRKNYNYNNFPEVKDLECLSQYKNCDRICEKIVFKKIPWLELCRVNFYKEQLQFYDYDIIKLSTRNQYTDAAAIYLDYWTSDEKSSFIPYMVNRSIKINDNNYETYLNWLESRSFCSNDCFHCRKCERFYNELIK